MVACNVVRILHRSASANCNSLFPYIRMCSAYELSGAVHLNHFQFEMTYTPHALKHQHQQVFGDIRCHTKICLFTSGLNPPADFTNDSGNWSLEYKAVTPDCEGSKVNE